MNRRELLASAAAGLAGLAGCLSSSGPASPPDGSSPTDGSPTGTDSATPTMEPTETPTRTPEGRTGEQRTGEETATPTDRSTATGEATPGSEDPPLVEEATLESGDGSCGMEPSATITETSDGLQVTGAVVASTPCYEASLLGFDDAGTEVRFRVGPEPPPGTPACQQCIGEIPFEMTARIRGSFDAAVVELEGETSKTVRKDLS